MYRPLRDLLPALHGVVLERTTRARLQEHARRAPQTGVSGGSGHAKEGLEGRDLHHLLHPRCNSSNGKLKQMHHVIAGTT